MSSEPTPPRVSRPPEVADALPNPWRLALFALGFVAVVALIGVVWWNAANGVPEGPTPPPAKKAAPEWQPVTEADHVCDDFRRLRNAGDEQAALALLGPEPVVPADEVNEADAERLQTDCFLRDPGLSIVRIRPTDKPDHYVFVGKGNVAAPRLSIRQADKELSSQQRTMSNPDLYVEVRGGKIFGSRSALHHE